MLSHHITLLLNLQRPPLQVFRIPRLVLRLIMSRHQKGRIREQIIHFLQRESRRLWQEQIKEHRVRKVTDDEEEIVAVTDVGHCYVGDLSDERVEGEGYHGGDGDTLGASTRVEDLGGDDPG